MIRQSSRASRPNRLVNRKASPFSKQSLAHAFRVMAPTLVALTFASAAHAQGTMDFSGAQTLMGTFKKLDRYMSKWVGTQWGRKETIIWPPHVPMLSYTAVATALLCTCLFIWQRFTFSMTPLQRSYVTEYLRSQIGGTFNAHESYRLLYLGGGKGNRTAQGDKV